MTLTCCKNKNQAKEKKEAQCGLRHFNAMVTMMSSLLFHSLPQVRLFFPFSPALFVVVIKSGHPEFLSPLHGCRHVCFQWDVLPPCLPLLPDLYLVPLMLQVALCCAPHAIKASLSFTPPPQPAPRCSSPWPLPPASAVVTNTVSHLICDSVLQNPRTLVLLEGPCLSS